MQVSFYFQKNYGKRDPDSIIAFDLLSLQDGHLVNSLWSRERPAQDPQKAQETRCGCGNFHDMSAQSLCPAHGTRCKACGQWNHWSQVWRSSQKTKPSSRKAKGAGQERKQRQGINALDTTEPDDDAPTGATPGTSQLYFHSLCIDSLSKTDTQAVLRIQVEFGECHPCKHVQSAISKNQPTTQMVLLLD